MARPKGSTKVPGYHEKNCSGGSRGVVRIDGRTIYCEGAYNSPESLQHYKRIIAEYLMRGSVQPAARFAASVGEVILGRITMLAKRLGDQHDFVLKHKRALGILNEHYGQTPAKDFTPDKLLAVRSSMINQKRLDDKRPIYRRYAVRGAAKHARCYSQGRAYSLGKYGSPESIAKYERIVKEWDEAQRTQDRRWCRDGVNRAVTMIKKMFKWAEETGLVPASTYHAISTVAPLHRGRGLPGEAKERDEVQPVEIERVRATMPYLSKYLQDFVWLQIYTSARGGELGRIRMCDIDMSLKVDVDGVAVPIWCYTPPQHKSAHRGHKRRIFIGPKGQEILKRYFKPDLSAYLFVPTEHQPAAKYPRKRACLTSETYHIAISSACRRAGIERWHPHQLRHLGLTEAREAGTVQFGGDGLEIVQAIAGHRDKKTSQRYAKVSVGPAARVLAKIG